MYESAYTYKFRGEPFHETEYEIFGLLWVRLAVLNILDLAVLLSVTLLEIPHRATYVYDSASSCL